MVIGFSKECAKLLSLWFWKAGMVLVSAGIRVFPLKILAREWRQLWTVNTGNDRNRNLCVVAGSLAARNWHLKHLWHVDHRLPTTDLWDYCLLFAVSAKYGLLRQKQNESWNTVPLGENMTVFPSTGTRHTPCFLDQHWQALVHFGLSFLNPCCSLCFLCLLLIFEIALGQKRGGSLSTVWFSQQCAGSESRCLHSHPSLPTNLLDDLRKVSGLQFPHLWNEKLTIFKVLSHFLIFCLSVSSHFIVT